MNIRMLKLNQVILIIVVAMFVLTTAFGFLAPIFAVFVTQQIKNGSVAVVGFAVSIYWIIKSFLQLVVAKQIDKNHGEVDDFYFFLGGNFLNAVSVSLYYFANEVWHVYAIHALLAIGDAMIVPPFYAIFTRHIDKGKEGFEWALYSSFSIGAGSALGGALGGILATLVGFQAIFPMVGVLSLVASVMLFFLLPYIRPKGEELKPRIYVDTKKV
jgi:predicted MFS family arabinose efflux permease